jgi:hypothetical protein
MSVVNPPLFNTSIFNNNAFQDSDNTLTLQDADNRYLQLTGGILTGALGLTPQTRTLSSFSVDGVLWHSNSSRFFASRQVGSDYISLLSYSAGGAFNDYITWNHLSGSPLMSIDCDRFEVSNSLLANNIRVMDSIDNTRFISCLDNDLGSGSSRAITLGRFNTLNNQAEISYRYSSTVGNATLNLGHFNSGSTLSIADNSRIGLGGSAETLSGARIFSIGSTSFLDGSYQTVHEFRTANGANKMLIELDPSGGDAFIGTSTANKFCFMYNNGRKMTIDNNLTTSNNAIDITGTYSYEIPAGVNYANITRTGSTFNITNSSGFLTNQWSLTCRSGFLLGLQLYLTSDRRLKENIKILNSDYVDNLYNQNIYSYNYKGHTATNIGFISQELLKSGYVDLLAFSPNPDLKKETDDDLEGTQMNLNYNSITICNSLMIKKLIQRIELLESKIN